ncbi:MAG: DUF6263 family protein [Planctomycetota bacterium]
MRHVAPRLALTPPLILIALVVSAAHAAENRTAEPAEAEAITLALQPAVGSRFVTETITDQTITQTVQGVEQVVKQKTTLGNSMKVIASENGNTTIAVTITRVAVEQSAPGLSANSYDSQTDQQAPSTALKPLATLPDTRYTVTCNPRGEVIASEGLDGLVDKMVESMGDTLEPQQLQMVKEQTRKQFGKRAMEHSVEAQLAHHPEQAVKPEDSWKRTITVEMGFPIQVSSEYVLQEYDTDLAQATLSSGMTAAEGEMQMGPMTVTPDLTGTQTGTVTIDRMTGWPVKLELVQNVEGSLHMQAQGQRMEIPMKVHMTMSHHATLQTDTSEADGEAPAVTEETEETETDAD